MIKLRQKCYDKHSGNTGGMVGGAVLSRILRGKTFTEKEAAQEIAKGFKVKKGKVTGDEVFMTKMEKLQKLDLQIYHMMKFFRQIRNLEKNNKKNIRYRNL